MVCSGKINPLCKSYKPPVWAWTKQAGINHTNCPDVNLSFFFSFIYSYRHVFIPSCKVFFSYIRQTTLQKFGKILKYNLLKDVSYAHRACIYLIKIQRKLVILWNIITYFHLFLWWQSWIFCIITSVFSLTRSFRNHYNMQIWSSRNIFYYYQWWIQCYLIFFMEAMMHFFTILSWK